MPESRYAPDGDDLAKNTSLMEEVLTSARDILIDFISSLPAHDKIYLVQEAQLACLHNLDIIKAHSTAKVTGDSGEQEQVEEGGNRYVINDDNSENAKE